MCYKDEAVADVFAEDISTFAEMRYLAQVALILLLD